MSDQKPLRSLDPARRRRRVVLMLVRVVATSVGLVALYYLAPLDELAKALNTLGIRESEIGSHAAH
jgi:hypothetical protein